MARRHRKKGASCPNCGHALEAGFEFCPGCGQENHDLRVPFKTFLYEFVENLTHFDTKLWNTLKAIFTRPGQLTKDFVEGKRARYVNPARFYIFTSVIFFALLTAWLDRQVEEGPPPAFDAPSLRIARLQEFVPASVVGLSEDELDDLRIDLPFEAPHYRPVADRLRQATPGMLDSLLGRADLDTVPGFRARLQRALAMLPVADSVAVDNYSTRINNMTMSFGSKRQEAFFRNGRMSEADVDSLLGVDRGSVSWVERRFIRSLGRLDMATPEGRKDFGHAVVKAVSIIMFILMPFTAVLLLWIFFRRRYYWEHLIFSVHTHTIFFLFLSVLLAIALLTGLQLPGWATPLLLLLGAAYLFASLRRVYDRSWGGTIGRFVLMGIPYAIAFFILMIAGVIWGFFSI